MLTQSNSQRQCIDKHAHGSVGSCTALHTAKQHRTKHNIIAPRALGQHLSKGQVKYAGRAYPALARLAAKAARQIRSDLQACLAYQGTISLDVLQPKRRGWLVNIPQHLPEERLMLCLAHTQTCLGHEIAKWQGRRQLHFSTLLN